MITAPADRVELFQERGRVPVADAVGPSLLSWAGRAIACRLYFDDPVVSAIADSVELF